MFTNLHWNESLKMAGARKRLVDELARKGIKNQRVLDALNAVPRQFFFPEDFEQYIYRDEAFPIGFGQTISQPYTVAFQTELLDVSSGMKVLEIGTGSGYQAAILCAMGAAVYSVEVIKELSEKASLVLNKIDMKLHLKVADGTLGWPEFAPFDRIIVTAGAPKVSSAFIEQLAPDGKLVIPVGSSTQSLVMKRFTKSAQGLKEESFGAFKFVPLKGEEGW